MTLLVCCFALSASAGVDEKVTGHVIPADSKSEWDFRGKLSPFFAGSISAKKLPECKTYEELRTTLEIALKELYACEA